MDGAGIGLLIAVIIVGLGSVGLSSLYLSLRRQLKQHDPSNTNLQLQSLAKKTNDFNIQYSDLVFGSLLGKGSQTAVLAGTPFFEEIFHQLGCQCVVCVQRLVKACMVPQS